MYEPDSNHIRVLCLRPLPLVASTLLQSHQCAGLCRQAQKTRLTILASGPESASCLVGSPSSALLQSALPPDRRRLLEVLTEAIFHSQGFVMEIAVYVQSATASESARMAGDPELDSRTSEEARQLSKS